jgi:hypothetical protein
MTILRMPITEQERNDMGKLMGRPGRKTPGAVRRMTIPTRRMAAVLLSVTLLSGAAAAWSTASANAEIAQVSSSQAKNVRPDALTVTLRFKDGDSYAYDCTIGQTWSVNATVVQVLNSCNTAVWLHQYNNNTGESWCTSAVLDSDPPEIVYANLYISNSTNSC